MATIIKYIIIDGMINSEREREMHAYIKVCGQIMVIIMIDWKFAFVVVYVCSFAYRYVFVQNRSKSCVQILFKQSRERKRKTD